jgi:hypothetical protein
MLFDRDPLPVRHEQVMGQVIAFSRSTARVAASADAALLLARLCSSSEFTEDGGWAELSALGGILILRYGVFLGLWVHQAGAFSYFPADEDEPFIQSVTLDEAYRLSVIMVDRSLPASDAEHLR